jgi:hypothetical protein
VNSGGVRGILVNVCTSVIGIGFLQNAVIRLSFRRVGFGLGLKRLHV